MSDHPPIVPDVLVAHGPFDPAELEELVHHWAKLDQRLQSFADRTIRIDLHLHDRDSQAQRVVLETHIGGLSPFVATAAGVDLGHILNKVRDETIRQLTDAKDRREPRHNKRLRASVRR